MALRAAENFESALNEYTDESSRITVTATLSENSDEVIMEISRAISRTLRYIDVHLDIRGGNCE